MRMIKNRLLVEPLKVELLTRSGIHLLERYNSDQMQFRVLAVGPEVKEVAVGDFILTQIYNGNIHKFDDGRQIINDTEVLALWQGNPDTKA